MFVSAGVANGEVIGEVSGESIGEVVTAGSLAVSPQATSTTRHSAPTNNLSTRTGITLSQRTFISISWGLRKYKLMQRLVILRRDKLFTKFISSQGLRKV